MPVIHSTDADFHVCQISFDTLLEIQLEAEDRGWATRWTSVDALRSQVKEEVVVLQSLMREERGGACADLPMPPAVLDRGCHRCWRNCHDRS